MDYSRLVQIEVFICKQLRLTDFYSSFFLLLIQVLEVLLNLAEVHLLKSILIVCVYHVCLVWVFPHPLVFIRQLQKSGVRKVFDGA